MKTADNLESKSNSESRNIRMKDSLDSTDSLDSQDYKTGLHRLALAVAGLTLVLLIVGGLVTSNEAGDSVPDWPLSFGRWLIDSQYFVANVRYEYSHRFIAGMVGVSTFVLALWLSMKDKRSWMRKLGWIAFAGVVAQALLGGVRVLLGEQGKTYIAVPHALVAQSFFATIISIALFTSRSWWRRASDSKAVVEYSTARMAAYTVAAVLIQLVLGAGFRHRVLGIVPHIVGALVVTGMIVWTAMTVAHRHAEDRYLKRPAITAVVLVFVQVLLGVAAYIARILSAGDVQPLEPMISLTVAHLSVGAMILADLVVLMLRCFQTLAPERSPGEIAGVRSAAA
jgi:cytochrome c oxidase assembly protein subunit 15